MSSIKSKIPLIVLIILLIIVIFFTSIDIIYEKQIFDLLDFIIMRQFLLRTLTLYVILIIFVIVLLFSQRTKKSKEISYIEKIFKKMLGNKLQHFKCPNCNEFFTVKNLKGNEGRSFVITCPCCGEIGRIKLKPKSKEIKFKCVNCGEQVSIWAEKTKSPHDIVVYSCPYCGERQSMKST